MTDLIVKSPFDGRQVGDRITGEAAAKVILDGYGASVIAIAPLDEAPADAALQDEPAGQMPAEPTPDTSKPAKAGKG